METTQLWYVQHFNLMLIVFIVFVLIIPLTEENLLEKHMVLPPAIKPSK